MPHNPLKECTFLRNKRKKLFVSRSDQWPEAVITSNCIKKLKGSVKRFKSEKLI